MLSVFTLNLLIKFVPPDVRSNGCIQLIVGRWKAFLFVSHLCTVYSHSDTVLLMLVTAAGG